MNCYKIDYEVDKKKYRDIFWEVYHKGEWYQFQKKRMCWWKVYGIDKMVEDVAKDLNIYGMNNKPRFAYLFQNNDLEYHLDEDYMTSIMINLNDGPSPIMHVEEIPIPYECIVFDNGHLFHRVEPRRVDTLMLKFCIRHPWEEVCGRLEQSKAKNISKIIESNKKIWIPTDDMARPSLNKLKRWQKALTTNITFTKHLENISFNEAAALYDHVKNTKGNILELSKLHEDPTRVILHAAKDRKVISVNTKNYETQERFETVFIDVNPDIVHEYVLNVWNKVTTYFIFRGYKKCKPTLNKFFSRKKLKILSLTDDLIITKK